MYTIYLTKVKILLLVKFTKCIIGAGQSRKVNSSINWTAGIQQLFIIGAGSPTAGIPVRGSGVEEEEGEEGRIYHHLPKETGRMLGLQSLWPQKVGPGVQV
jgi:hypothetical protein